MSTPTDFLTLTTPRSLAPGRFEATIPDGWQQGRGAFGGLVVANLIRALEASEPTTERPLRSLTAELCGPVMPGQAAIAVESLRRGTGVTTLAARLEQGGEVLAHAVGVFGRPRADRIRRTFLEPPSPPPWRDLEPLDLEPFGPPFARFFDMRCTGPLPFTAPPAPVASGWVRPRHPGAARDAAYIAGCVDAWWPASYATDAGPYPRPVGTIAYTLELAATLEGLDPEAPLFYQARVLAEHDGYLIELRELWGEDGRLLALNPQTIAVIR